jgi:hypothetical protein
MFHNIENSKLGQPKVSFSRTSAKFINHTQNSSRESLDRALGTIVNEQITIHDNPIKQEEE